MEGLGYARPLFQNAHKESIADVWRYNDYSFMIGSAPGGEEFQLGLFGGSVFSLILSSARVIRGKMYFARTPNTAKLK